MIESPFRNNQRHFAGLVDEQNGAWKCHEIMHVVLKIVSL
jgi:hypothetical protein